MKTTEGGLRAPFSQINDADPLEAALVFAALGARVIPLVQGTKRPHTKWAAATDDSDGVFELWRRYPEADVGLLTGADSGIVVVDGDGPEGVENARTLLGPTETLRVKTSRGYHWYFTHPRDRWIPTSAGRVAPGVDVRGDGGLIVAPPSAGRLVNNPEVEGLAPFPLESYQGAAPGERVDVDLAELPSVESEDETAVATRERMVAALLGAPQGQRNQILYQAGSDLFFLAQCGGLDGRETALLLAEAAHEAGLNSTEIPGTIRSAVSNGAGKAPPVLTIDAGALDIAELLDRVVTFMKRFVVFAHDAQPRSIALWVVHTHCAEAASCTPYIWVSSPAPTSGKTRLTEVVELLVHNPLRASDASPAAIYRAVPLWRPTLLLDELDTKFRAKGDDGAEDLRRLINSGFNRGAYVFRVEGKERIPTKFETYCPKMLVGIDTGAFPDTVAKRSIPIRLHRKTRTEEVERFRSRMVSKEAEQLRSSIAAWARAHRDKLATAEPRLPDDLNDRQQDAWECLLAIADMAGSEWGRRARAAATKLHGGLEDETTDAVLLLEHIRDAFDALRSDKLLTGVLLSALIERDDGPWAIWWENDVRRDNVQGPGAKLARILRTFDVRPKALRIATGVGKGYERAQFETTWARYFDTPPSSRNSGNSAGGATRSVTAVTASGGV